MDHLEITFSILSFHCGCDKREEKLQEKRLVIHENHTQWLWNTSPSCNERIVFKMSFSFSHTARESEVRKSKTELIVCKNKQGSEGKQYGKDQLLKVPAGSILYCVRKSFPQLFPCLIGEWCKNALVLLLDRRSNLAVAQVVTSGLLSFDASSAKYCIIHSVVKLLSIFSRIQDIVEARAASVSDVTSRRTVGERN